METAGPRLGLRERKKQKTRETIIDVALGLFVTQGYEQTTIAEIAEAADVSRSTVFTYFPSKEDILFSDLPELQQRLATALRERPEGATALDALREFIIGSLTPYRHQTLRRAIVATDESLGRDVRARYAPLEKLIADAIADDLHAGPGDVRPHVVAAAVFAAFNALGYGDPDQPPQPFSLQHATAVIDDVMRFLRAGLQALRDP